MPLNKPTGTAARKVSDNWNLDTERAWIGRIVGGKFELIHNQWYTSKWPRLKEPKDSGSWKSLA